MMLWPDRSAGELRGELTIDPELTRSLDVQPTPEHSHAVVEFLKRNIQISADAVLVPLDFEIRELWVRGGATPGDLIVFTVPLGRGSRDLRVFASDAFKALVVSVQVVSDTGTIDTTSWLARGNEWTPSYRIGAGWQQSGWRSGVADVFSVDPPPESRLTEDRSAIAMRFIGSGFEHILPGGFDHVLFVAALVLGSARRYRRLLLSLSLFTIAHTLTLALGKLELVKVSPGLVEPLIAFSIFALAVHNLWQRQRSERPALTGSRAPMAEVARSSVVFCFGLVHGLGFANALSELSFDTAHFALALVSFNVGVELGQLVVALLLSLLLHPVREPHSLRKYAVLPGSAVIAAAGLVLAIDRLR